MFFTAAVQAKIDAQIKEALDALRTELTDKYEQDRDTIKAQILQELKDQQEEEQKKRLASDEPYFNWVTRKVSEDGVAELVFDWNKAFIRYLRELGLRAHSEEALVEMWLIQMGKQMQTNMAQNSLQE